MLNVGKTHATVRVVNDQIGTPTYTYDLARLLVDMNETEKLKQKAAEDSFYQKLLDGFDVNVLIVGDSIGEGAGTETDGQ